MFISLLYFLTFILISSYLFFSKYLEFCEKYINNKNERKNKITENINIAKFQRDMSISKNKSSNIIIDVECEVINDKNKLKGYLE